MLNTYFLISCEMSEALVGETSDGLMMTVLPAAMAAMAGMRDSCTGKFHAPST